MFNRTWNRIKSFFSALVQTRTYIIIILFFILFGILVGRIFDLQIINGQSYVDGYKLQIQKTKSIQGTRGNIYDRNGKLLAYNELAYSVTIEDNGDYEKRSDKNKELNDVITKVIKIVEKNEDTVINDFNIVLDENNKYKFVPTSNAQILRFIADIYGKKTVDQLSEEQQSNTAEDIIDYLCNDDTYGYGINTKKLSKEEVLQLINIRYAIGLNSYQKYLETTIAEDVSDETVAAIMENLDNLQGVDIKEESLRRYNDSEAFASFIGYIGQISQEEYNELSKEDQEKYSLNEVVGKSGLEKELDSYLQGESGEVKLYVNNVGKVMDMEEGAEAKAGNDVFLTIDYDLQVATYKILEQELAGILLSRIQNTLDYDKDNVTDNTQIIIPVGDVYNALISNNILNLNKISAADASNTSKTVNETFQANKKQVLEKIGELIKNSDTPVKDLSKEEQAYVQFIINDTLSDRYQVIMSSEIDKSDETYLRWQNNKDLSVKEYLNYIISKNWIDVSKLVSDTEKEKYLDSKQIFNDMTDFVISALDVNNSFDKIVYSYMIKTGAITGNQLCVLLYDQGVLPFDEAQYNRLLDGSLMAYDFIRGKIQTLDITPGQLALEPCSGSAVITKSGTGEVLACVSYPGYDNNRLANTMDSDYYNQLVTDKSRPFYNKATQEETAPGSTYKPLVAIAGLSENVIDTNSIINCTGEFEKVTPHPKCWIYPGAHGGENVTSAISHSCNIFFFEVGWRLSQTGDEEKSYSSTLGTNNLAKYATQFGLSEPSGIEIPETDPKISDESSVPSAIGQGTNNYTTTQLAKYIDGIATKGKVYDLTLLDRVEDKQGEVIKKFDSTLSNEVTTLSDENWNAVHSGMVGVIPNNFTSVFKEVTGSGLTIASKSGTAQQSKKDPDHALYVGFAPANDPEITFAVRMTNGYTSTYAAEVSSDILRYYYNTSPREEIVNGVAKTLSTNKISHSD